MRLRSQLEEKLQLLSQANRQLKRKIFDLYTVFEISRNFNAVLDYDMLVDTFDFHVSGPGGRHARRHLRNATPSRSNLSWQNQGIRPAPEANPSVIGSSTLSRCTIPSKLKFAGGDR